MAFFDHHLLSFMIRWIHTVAMAVLLGGSILLWGLSVFPGASRRAGRDDVLLLAAERFEWLFWGALGTLVMTGVGNLAAFGEFLPGDDSDWGVKLMAKLSAVLVFSLLSLLRTLLVIRLCAAADIALSARGHTVLQGSYAATVLFLAVILGLAVSLAHG